MIPSDNIPDPTDTNQLLPRRVGAWEWSQAIRRAVRAGLPRTIQHIALLLATYMDPDGGGAWPSIDTIAEDCGRKRATVISALKTLADAGWLQREPGAGSSNGGRPTTRYTATLPADFGPRAGTKARDDGGDFGPPTGTEVEEESGDFGAPRGTKAERDFGAPRDTKAETLVPLEEGTLVPLGEDFGAPRGTQPSQDPPIDQMHAVQPSDSNHICAAAEEPWHNLVDEERLRKAVGRDLAEEVIEETILRISQGTEIRRSPYGYARTIAECWAGRCPGPAGCVDKVHGQEAITYYETRRRQARELAELGRRGEELSATIAACTDCNEDGIIYGERPDGSLWSEQHHADQIAAVKAGASPIQSKRQGELRSRSSTRGGYGSEVVASNFGEV